MALTESEKNKLKKYNLPRLNKWKRTGEKNGEVYNDQAQLLGNIFTFHKYSYSSKTTR